MVKNAIGKQVTTTVTQTNVSQTIRGAGNITSGSGNIIINGDDIIVDNYDIPKPQSVDIAAVEKTSKYIKNFLAKKYGEEFDIYIAYCKFENSKTPIEWLDVFNEEITTPKQRYKFIYSKNMNK